MLREINPSSDRDITPIDNSLSTWQHLSESETGGGSNADIRVVFHTDKLTRSLLERRRFNLRRSLAATVIAINTSLAAACGGGPKPIPSGSAEADSPRPGEVLGASEAQPPEDPNGLVLPFRRGETWYFLQGDHANSIDIGPKQIIHCKDPATGIRIEPYPTPPNEWVTASQSGTVLVVGDEEDRSNRNHSLVQIKGSDGTIINYVHLDNIKVKKDHQVLASQELGQPSCEFPPDGDNTGVHVHLTVVGGINDKTFSGWTVQGNRMISSVGTRRIADGGRCGEGSNCIKNGEVFRNDLVRGPVGTMTGGVGNVPGPGTTEIPLTSNAPENPAENFSVDEQIENLFSNITPENQEQAIDIIALKEWLRYLNKTQVDSSGNILQTQILNFSEFGADQLEGLLRDGPTTVPLKVSAVHLEKRDTYTVKSNYDLELNNITLFRGQRFDEFGHRAITYQLRFRGLIYTLNDNISDEMAELWVNKIPDEEMSEWSEFYWGEVYIFNDRDGTDETVKLQGNMDNTKNDEIQIPFKIKRISENYMNEKVQRGFHQYAPQISCAWSVGWCIDVDLEDLNSSSW